MRNAFSAMNAFFVTYFFGVHSACAYTGIAMYTFLFVYPYSEERERVKKRVNGAERA